jgi:hypothetical protein
MISDRPERIRKMGAHKMGDFWNGLLMAGLQLAAELACSKPDRFASDWY